MEYPAYLSKIFVSLYAWKNNQKKTQDLTLAEVANLIQKNSKHEKLIKELRGAASIDKASIKDKLPCVTFTGVFPKRDQMDFSSGCLFFEIPKPGDFSAKFKQFTDHKRSVMVYASPSQKSIHVVFYVGYKGKVASQKEKQKHHYKVLKAVEAEFGLSLPKALQAYNTFTFLSHDSALWVNPNDPRKQRDYKLPKEIINQENKEDAPYYVQRGWDLLKIFEKHKGKFDNNKADIFISDFTIWLVLDGWDKKEGERKDKIKEICIALFATHFGEKRDVVGRAVEKGRKYANKGYHDPVFFWDGDLGNKKISVSKLQTFLENEGYVRHEKAGYAQKEKVWLIKKSKTDIYRFLCEHMRPLLRDKKDYNRLSVHIYRNGEQVYDLLTAVKDKDMYRSQSKREEAFFPYKNCVVHCKADKYWTIDFERAFNLMGGYAWEPPTAERNFEILPEKEYLKSAYWKHLCITIGGVRPKADEENIYSKNLQKQMLSCITSALGFLIHPHKDKSLCPAIQVQDQDDLNNIKPGGTGKDIISDGVKYIVFNSFLDGRARNNEQFLFDPYEEGSALLHLGDPHDHFKWDQFFNVITNQFNINKKFGKLKVPFKESPKVMITMNKLSTGDDDADSRRRYIIQVSKYFDLERLPIHVFKKVLFDDWDDREWLQFDNLMMSFACSFIKDGLAPVPPIMKDKEFKQRLINMIGGDAFFSLEKFLDAKIRKKRQKLNKKAWGLEDETEKLDVVILVKDFLDSISVGRDRSMQTKVGYAIKEYLDNLDRHKEIILRKKVRMRQEFDGVEGDFSTGYIIVPLWGGREVPSKIWHAFTFYQTQPGLLCEAEDAQGEVREVSEAGAGGAEDGAGAGEAIKEEERVPTEDEDPPPF